MLDEDAEEAWKGWNVFEGKSSNVNMQTSATR